MNSTIKSISIPSLCNFKASLFFNKNLISVPAPIAGARSVFAHTEHYAPKGVLYINTDAASVN